MVVRWPTFCDLHVHAREPGGTAKEDWDSVTRAALAGGYTQILAMPNTQPAVIDRAALADVERRAAGRARCDWGVYLGGTNTNAAAITPLAAACCGLKLYLDHTFGDLLITGLAPIIGHCERWPAGRLLVAHAEERSLAALLLAAHQADRPVHVCHVSRASEIRTIARAKAAGWAVTCEVTPHHLTWDRESAVAALGAPRAEVRPELATPADRAALWEHAEIIDCLATDHAPHLAADKDRGTPGFPGLETALPVLLGAVHAGRLSERRLLDWLANNPRRIAGLAEPPASYLEVDLDAPWTYRARRAQTRCGWSPWEGQDFRGRVTRVVVRGAVVYDGEAVLAPPGTGQAVHPLLNSLEERGVRGEA